MVPAILTPGNLILGARRRKRLDVDGHTAAFASGIRHPLAVWRKHGTRQHTGRSGPRRANGIEPLGFAESSLRLKREAVEAIDSVGGAHAFRLIHDTFHHAVAGERELFPDNAIFKL